MSAPVHPLRLWRESRAWSPRAAARRLGVSPECVAAIEAGALEPGTALMLEIFTRTDGVVWLGDPECDPSIGDPASRSPGEPAGAAAFPTPRGAAAPIEDPGHWSADAASGLVSLARRDPAGTVAGWALSPERAATLALQLIHAALAAIREGKTNA